MKLSLFNYSILTLTSMLLFCSCKKEDDEGSSNIGAPIFYSELEAATIDSNKKWVWIDKANMFSRNGNTIGYAASMNKASKKVLIYLEGGGACFNLITCTNNSDGLNDESINKIINSLSEDELKIMSRTNLDNKFNDWNFIYVPYTTGDFHSGSNESADVPNGGPLRQKMVGYENVTAVVNSLKEYSIRNEIDEILLSGVSAGAVGVQLNFIQVADAFPNAKLSGLIDSGPIFMDTAFFSQCFESLFTNVFKVPIPSDLNSFVTRSHSYPIQGIYEYVAKKYPNANFGLLNTYEDDVLRAFYGFPYAECDSFLNVPGDTFKAALLRLKNEIDHFPNWNFYLVEGDNHTFIGNESYETTIVNGVPLTDWVSNITDGIRQDVIE